MEAYCGSLPHSLLKLKHDSVSICITSAGHITKPENGPVRLLLNFLPQAFHCINFSRTAKRFKFQDNYQHNLQRLACILPIYMKICSLKCITWSHQVLLTDKDKISILVQAYHPSPGGKLYQLKRLATRHCKITFSHFYAIPGFSGWMPF